MKDKLLTIRMSHEDYECLKKNVVEGESVSAYIRLLIKHHLKQKCYESQDIDHFGLYNSNEGRR